MVVARLLGQHLATAAAERHADAGGTLCTLHTLRTGIALRALGTFRPGRTGFALYALRARFAARRQQAPAQRIGGRRQCRGGFGDADIAVALMLDGIVALVDQAAIPGPAPGEAARTLRPGIAGRTRHTLRSRHALQALRPLGTLRPRIAAAEIDATRPVGRRRAQLEE